VHSIRFFPEIDEPNTYFASVIRIDRSGSIDDAYPMLKGKTASRPYLSLKARRKGNGNSCGDYHDGAYWDDSIPFNRCTQIHP
jgi:hypothetical protein